MGRTTRETAESRTLTLKSGATGAPGGAGALLVRCGARTVRVDASRPSITLGRSADCDLVVEDIYASRQHATIKLRRMRFYLLDHSTNGTFVSMRGEEVHLARGEVLLGEAGVIALGRRHAASETGALRFERVNPDGSGAAVSLSAPPDPQRDRE